MRLGIIAALPQELGPALKALPTTKSKVEHLVCFESPSLIFTVAGIGRRRAAAAALVVANKFKPHALVSIGFCGALTDDLETGDLVLGGTSVHGATTSLIDLALSDAIKARRGNVVTVDKVVLDAEEKRKLAKESGAIVVDMEADGIAVAAQSRGLAFLAVKIVIDTPSSPLSSSYGGCWPVFKDLLRGRLMGMMLDAKRVKLAAERLKDFLVALSSAT
jgi:nucleoside phosphorylase